MRGGIGLDSVGRRCHVDGSDEPLQRRAWPRGTRRACGCPEDEAGMADTGRCTDGVGVGKGSKKEVSFYALVLVICEDSSSFDRIYAHAVII